MNRLILVASFCLTTLLLQNRPHAAEVENEIFFTADLSGIIGTGAGFFDPSQDVLNLMGLDWVGATVVEEKSDRRFEQDAFNPNLFYSTMVIRGREGDSTKWKAKAEPEDRFFNWGWEISPDYWYTIQEDDYYAEITYKPNIFPIQLPIEEDVTVLFQVDMNRAKNYYTQEAIDPASVEWVGLKGQNSVLGSWAGSWLPTDTLSTSRTLHVLKDKGINGDKVAGDFVFSTLVTFPAGNEGGPGLFKYGAYYPGALEANGGVNPLDNEMHGTDHWIDIHVGGQAEIFNRFGVLEGLTGITERVEKLPESVELLQNFPNPFNPTTTVRYFLRENTKVSLAVYNLQGQQVAVLVDGLQFRGEHVATFNAVNLSSGVYLYRLQTENICLTRKMILVK
ncbi:T9SS type A sorting domain-containing protein [candidate division KSB1 bacterium]|nr:T9SS type A sorting domain-containing protein [candidate division KSB1 bacterium]